MTIKEHFRRNVKLAFPVMIGQLGHIMVSVADTAMVGQVGVIPLAGITFAGTIYHLLLLFGIGFSYAITPLVASTKPDDRPTLLGYIQNAGLLNLSFGVILFLISLSIYPFLHLFGQDPQVVVAARQYFIMACMSIIPLMLYQTLRQFSEGLSDTFRPMIVSITANILNVGLNYLLIFGKFGFPEMGVLGAATATFISRIFMFFLMLIVTKKKWKGIRLEFQISTIKRLISLGIPSGLQFIFEIGAFAMAAIMVGWISPQALAAHQIALNLAAITYMAASGIAAASTIRIGNQMGLQDIRNLRIAGYSCFVLVTLFMGFCGLIFILFRSGLTGLYIDDPSVRQLAASLLIIAAGFQISDGLQVVGLGVLRGLTDVKIPTIVTFIAYWLLAIPGSYILGFIFELGVFGVWYALLGGLTIAAILHISRFRGKVRRLSF